MALTIKKLLKPVVTGLLATSLLASQLASAETLKLATEAGSKDSPAGEALRKWGDLIEKNSNGEIDVKVFYQNELGGQQEMFDLLMAGDLDIMLNWPMTSYDKRMGVVYAPYMTLSWEEAVKAYSPGGWVNNMLGSIYADAGLKFFGPWPEGFNGVATRGKYSVNMADSEGLKVRTLPAFPFPQTVQALGYQTAGIDWGEVYTSLQTGVVDGEAGNVIFWDYEYFRDALDYYVRTKHMFMTAILTMNLDSYESLSEEHQKIISDAATVIMNDQFKAAKATDELYVSKWKAAGKQYFEPTEEQLNAMAKSAREKVWPLMADEFGTKIMATIEKNAKPL
ncbi:TRAP transporter substrate-binding protein DctP [Pontibacterium granulatum]|uniref:TRAP transporter substrate-binding protein DctP n=1 Tax=Pontibacterium granulatum TaxID=2036029 RepID=UPI00249CC8DB|nr:TRAP transporter substrate-binding protein DctP [Pontibacterium granulatum]MDI3325778.1 TRAP transporter substrate-binding protein DctP [Pontibacterium granulatum]